MTVLFKHQPWNASGAEDGTEIEWNMWQYKQDPYNQVEVGTRFVTVSGGGPAKGMLMSEVEAVCVVKEPYSSHDEAWTLMRTGMGTERITASGLTKANFLKHEYTADAPHSGVLLGVAYTAVRRLGVPRPAKLRFRPNGWARLDAQSVPDLVA